MVKRVWRGETNDGFCYGLEDGSFLNRDIVIDHLLDGEDCQTAFSAIV